MNGLPIGLEEGERFLRLDQDYTGRLMRPDELAPFTSDGAVPVTIAEQVGAYTTYLASDHAPPRFRDGYEQLGGLLTRHVELGNATATLQHNPGRARNTKEFLAPAMTRTSCFLDPENLTDGERGLEYGNSVILGNLYPYLRGHLVIVDRSHAPQDLGPQLHTALELATGLPSYYIFYNGPKVGATAPDHLHLQAGLSSDIPILGDLQTLEAERPKDKLRLPVASDSVEAFIPTSIDRTVLVVRGYDHEDVVKGIGQAVAILTGLPNIGLLDANFGVALQGKRLTGLVFPRSRLRHPDFSQSDSPKLTPAAAELSGLWPVPVEHDYRTITAAQIKEIIEAVSIPIPLLRNRLGKIASAS